MDGDAAGGGGEAAAAGFASGAWPAPVIPAAMDTLTAAAVAVGKPSTTPATRWIWLGNCTWTRYSPARTGRVTTAMVPADAKSLWNRLAAKKDAQRDAN